jgi:hypothetical protein
MLNQAKLNKALNILLKRFEDVNRFFVFKIADQIKKIGGLSQTNINRLMIMASMNADMIAINKQLADAVNMGTADIFKIYNNAMNDVYTDPAFSQVLNQTPLTAAQQGRLNQYVQSVSMQTAGTIQNLSNTTALSKTYMEAVDKAVLAVSSGLGDYKSATREIVRSLGYNGMQVHYESGYHRRLDTAVRQNIIDGANQIAQNGSILMGEMLGFDAYEISAHARSAPDHEPVQGRVFLKADFESMQKGLPFRDVDGHMYQPFKRPIGEWNCMHIAMSFSTQHSVRRYTDEQLAQWAADNQKGCEIDGKHYTIYQASQLMRQIETEVRRQKDTANMARQAGDEVLRQQCQVKINALGAKYAQVVKESGIASKKDRMVVEGFRAVKVK